MVLENLSSSVVKPASSCPQPSELRQLNYTWCLKTVLKSACPCQVLCKGQPQIIFLAFLCKSVPLGCDLELLLCSVLTLFTVAALTWKRLFENPWMLWLQCPLNSVHWICCAVWSDKWCQQSIQAPERGESEVGKHSFPVLRALHSGILSKRKKSAAKIFLNHFWVTQQCWCV